jgi:hypothetical protein
MTASRYLPPSLRIAGQLLLALAVLLGSLAWQPAAVQAAPQQETAAKVKLNAWIVGSRLYIDAQNLPGKQYFVVRVRSFTNSDWVRLGRIKSTRQGDAAAGFRLPNYLHRYDRLQVCLKSASTDKTYCTRVVRY